MQMQITLDQALDAAVDKLPFVRRRVMKNRLRSNQYRENLKYLPLLLNLLLPLFSSLLWMLVVLSISNSAVAQQKICINGTCYTIASPTPAPPLMPVVNATAKATVKATRSIVEFALPPYPQVQQAASTRGHWSYPGDLATHLARSHNVSAAGLTRQEQLSLHDSLHRTSSYQYSQRRPVVYRGPIRRLFWGR